MRYSDRCALLSATFLAGLLALSPAASLAQAVTIGAKDIGGAVTSAQGPEAGVWVIAETTDLPTKFAKIVVTDDAGRYVIPTCRQRNTKSGCGVMA